MTPVRAEKSSPKVSLNVNREGFSILQKGEPAIRVLWSEINQILAYKRDLVTEDLVCWDITVTKNERSQTYSLHEELDGFGLLVDCISHKLTSFDKIWRQKIITPPFAENLTILYQKKEK